MRVLGHKTNLTANIGILIIAINLAVAVLGPWIAPYGEADILGDAWADPSPEYWLGLDNLGRDLLSRMIYGARISIGLAFLITMLSFTIGIVTGFAAAVSGGKIDMFLSRLVDLLLSMPTLIFAFMILSVLGTDIPVLIVTIAILDSTKVFRLARAVAMNISVLEYVEAAKARGEGLWWIIRAEILPNAIPPLVAEFGLRFCFTFLFVAALSFLGLGIQPPDADWGSMVKDYRDMINLGMLTPLYPAGAIALLTVGINFVVDWMLSSIPGLRERVHERDGIAFTVESWPKAIGPVLDVVDLRIEARSERGEGIRIVDDVSFTLARGEVLGLIGESGAGKSTIGLAALGYARNGCGISGGKLLFEGRDIRAMTSQERRALRGSGVAYIAQSAAASFNPAMTIMEQVCEVPRRIGLMKGREAREAAITLFRELDLPKPETFGDRYPHQVSGGQLQRAMAAMAMAARPKIVVFDEPTTALDVTTQVEVLASFRKLIRSHGTAALYITHDLAVVAQIADRIMVLKRGKTVEVGAATQILQAPREDYTRRLVTERTVAATPKPLAPADAARPILDVSRVTASYVSAFKVIDDVSLQLFKGDTLAVVGESGSGKSTLARVIAGLLPREAGEVTLDGETLAPDLRSRPRDQLRRVQMIYQIPDVSLNPRQTLFDVIGRPMQFYFNRTRKETRARVIELLKMIDLPESFIDRYPPELSGGQKQRVSIARALAAEPEVIICDEVTSALDQLVGEEILRLLKRLQEDRGLAYLFITHDLGTVKRIANKVAVMLKGKLVASGPLSEVFTPPRHEYTDLLLSSVPEMRADWLDEVLAKRPRKG